MVTFESFIHSYGYFAIFLGMFIEGETILALAGYFSGLGYFSITLVILYAIIATLIADQLWFHLGRLKGRKILLKHEFIRNRVERVHNFLGKYETHTMLTYRFIYGMRITTALLLGSSKASAKKFFFIDIATVIVWVSLYTLLGYIFGSAISPLIARMKDFELQMLAAVAIILLVVFVVRHLVKKYSSSA